MSSSSNDTINSIGVLRLNNLSTQAITLGSGGGLTTVSNGLTSTGGVTTLGTSTIGAITGTSATFSSTLGVTSLITASGGLTSTAGVTTLGTSTIGAITGTSATFSSTVGVTSLLTASGGLTSTAGTTNLGSTTFAGSSTLNIGNNKLTNIGAPVSANDATTKSYVDTLFQGLSSKAPVDAATTGPLVLTSDFEVGDVIDGHTLILNDRVLIKDQTDQTENGIYSVNATSTPTRTADFFTGAGSSGSVVFVQDGTVNKGLGFICTSQEGSDIIGTNNLIFVQFSGAGQVIAGTGLTKTGNTLSVNASQTQITTVGTLLGLTVSTPGLTATAATTSLGSTTFAAASSVDLNSNKIINLATPTLGTDAVTKTYSDTAIYPVLNFKQSVKAASISSVILVSEVENGDTLDGYTLVTGDRILLKNQSTASENGIYTVNVTGAPTRATDLAVSRNAAGIITFVVYGTTNSSSYFICVSAINSDVVGTNNLTFANSNALAGTGLTNTGNTFSVNANQSQITTVGTLGGLNVSGNTATGSLTVNGIPSTPSLNDINIELSFTSNTNPVNAVANVTGLLVSYTTCRAFKAFVSVTIAGSNLYQLFELIGVYNGTSWYFIPENWGDNTQTTFVITSSGQIQYTQTVISGFTSCNIKFKLVSLSI